MRCPIMIKLIALVTVVGSLASCVSVEFKNSQEHQQTMRNPVSYFEIPVTNIDRAVAFYEVVFATSFERTTIDDLDMALFPSKENGDGISGALVRGESYTPSKKGPRIYFSVDSIDLILSRVVANSGTVAYPKTAIGKLGWVAEFIDSEGNQIALHSDSE